jgi:hypothetical protein
MRAFLLGVRPTSGKQQRARWASPWASNSFPVSSHLSQLFVSWPTRFLRTLGTCTAATHPSPKNARDGTSTCEVMAIMLVPQNCASCWSGVQRTVNRFSLEHCHGGKSNRRPEDRITALSIDYSELRNGKVHPQIVQVSFKHSGIGLDKKRPRSTGTKRGTFGTILAAIRLNVDLTRGRTLDIGLANHLQSRGCHSIDRERGTLSESIECIAGERRRIITGHAPARRSGVLGSRVKLNVGNNRTAN